MKAIDANVRCCLNRKSGVIDVAKLCILIIIFSEQSAIIENNIQVIPKDVNNKSIDVAPYVKSLKIGAWHSRF